MKTKHLAVAGLILCLGLGIPAGLAGRPAGDPQARLRLRERISDLYLLRLTRALELTEEQTAKLYPVLTRVEKEKAEPPARHGPRSPGPPGGAGQDAAPGRGRSSAWSRGSGEARRAIREKDDEVEAVLERVLTPVQRARYLVFTVDFLRTVGENLDRARGGPGPHKKNPLTRFADFL